MALLLSFSFVVPASANVRSARGKRKIAPAAKTAIGAAKRNRRLSHQTAHVSSQLTALRKSVAKDRAYRAKRLDLAANLRGAAARRRKDARQDRARALKFLAFSGTVYAFVGTAILRNISGFEFSPEWGMAGSFAALAGLVATGIGMVGKEELGRASNELKRANEYDADAGEAERDAAIGLTE